MAHSRQSPDANLRDYLHAELCDFVEMVENKANAQKDIALATEVRRVHQARLDALLEGEEVRGIPRYDLPEDHPESTVYGGNPGDRFTLTVDDELVADTVTPPITMNRADRRRSGQRGRGLNLNGDGDGSH